MRGLKGIKAVRNWKGLERKWGVWLALGLLVLFGAIFFWLRSRTTGLDEAGLAGPGMQLAQVEEGSLASSNLLTGSVQTVSEEKIYFDSNRGSSIASYYVGVGDYVFQGQPVMQYATGPAQSAYDQAVRALNKTNRQIEDFLLTGGQTTASSTAEGGEEAPTMSPAYQATLYQNQLQDLYDAQADAQLAVDKAYETLAQTLEVSAVNGRVVELNTSLDPSKTGGQLIMHIVNEGLIEVEGSLTEYDLATVRVGQAVKVTSKVYPDKSWMGRVSYVSYYPAEAASQTGASTSSSASYPFKITFDGPAPELKQGFKVNIEVVSQDKSPLVPLGALVPDGDKTYVWVYDQQTETIAKVEVGLGRADALNQEITSGLRPGQQVILYPSLELTDGQTLSADQLLGGEELAP